MRKIAFMPVVQSRYCCQLSPVEGTALSPRLLKWVPKGAPYLYGCSLSVQSRQHPLSSNIQQSRSSIILETWHRRPWRGRRAPRGCAAASRSPQLYRRRPRHPSSLRVAMCWAEGPFWDMHMYRWTAARTPQYRQRSTHWSYSQLSISQPDVEDNPADQRSIVQ